MRQALRTNNPLASRCTFLTLLTNTDTDFAEFVVIEGVQSWLVEIIGPAKIAPS